MTEQELVEFKARVREEAVRLSTDQGWPTSRVNEVLARLDLEPLPEPQNFTFTGAVKAVLTYTVRAVDADTAKRQAAEQLASDVTNLNGRDRYAVAYPQGVVSGVEAVGEVQQAA